MGRFNGKHGRGYSRKLRELKRTEAEIRNEAYQERKTQLRDRPLRSGESLEYSGSVYVQNISTAN